MSIDGITYIGLAALNIFRAVAFGQVKACSGVVPQGPLHAHRL